jgi:cytochrome c-type biogenesis protein CcmE
MKRKHQRALFVGAGLAVLALATTLVLNSLGQSLNYFLMPTEVLAGEDVPQGTFQLGGLVSDGSFEADDEMGVSFQVEDGSSSLSVVYDQVAHGLLPDLFREGQGVIVEGQWDGSQFVASRVLAKHDENYMPPEVAEGLKEMGEWRGEETP